MSRCPGQYCVLVGGHNGPCTSWGPQGLSAQQHQANLATQANHGAALAHWTGDHPPPAAPTPNAGAFVRAVKTEMDAAWRSLAIADLRRERGVWTGTDYVPPEEDIQRRQRLLEKDAPTSEACGCDESKALRAELEVLRARLARLEGGA